MAHTPGPWVYDPTNKFYKDAPFIVWTSRGPGYGAIAETKSSGLMPRGDGTEQADNARLTAAAPDLLKACKEFVKWYGERTGEADKLLPIEQQPPEIQEGMRAIAKAEPQ